MNEEELTFPIYFTEEEMHLLLQNPLPVNIHCKIHDTLSIMLFGEIK